MAEDRKESPTPIPSISYAHSGALMARFLTLEQDCRQMDRLLDGYEGIYYQQIGVFAEETRVRIRTLLSAIRERIARIKEDLNLPQRQMDIAKLLGAYLSEMWVTLHETKAQALRGYGEVPNELSAYLDPRVDEILELHARLREALQEARIEGKPARASNELS